MKLFKKIATVFLVIIVLFLLGGYLYFQKKFTPPENYLKVLGIAENIPTKWISSSENAHSALLLPIKIKGIDRTFYMQFDSGSPVTVFYKKSLESIAEKFQNQLKIDTKNNTISTAFRIGKMDVVSNDFGVLNYGEKISFDNSNAVDIIGTIGTDLLEKRIAILDFKNNQCSFIEKTKEDDFAEFEFKKRKILIPSIIEKKI